MSALSPLPLPLPIPNLFLPRPIPNPSSQSASPASGDVRPGDMKALAAQAHLQHLANYLKLQLLIGQHLDHMLATPLLPAPSGPPPKALEEMAKLIEPLGSMSQFNQVG